MISFRPKITSLLAAMVIIVLSACGGGGGGSDNSNNGFTTSNNSNTKPQVSSADNVSSASSAKSNIHSATSSLEPAFSSTSDADQTSKSQASTSSISSSSKASNSSTSRVTIDTVAPTMTTNVEVVFTEYDLVVFSWMPSTDNVGVTSYKIYRNQIQIDQFDASDLTYADFNVAPDNTYTYGVSAGDAVGNWSPIKTILAKTKPQPVPPSSASSSRPSSSSSSSTSSKSSSALSSLSSKSSSSLSSSLSSTSDTTPPSAPSSIFQVGVSATQVDIGWTSATDNIAVTTYYIYRDNILLGSLASNTLTFSDNTVQASKLYTYSIESGDAAGNKSLARKSIFVTTPPEVVTGDVTLYWAPPTQREDGTTITGAELGGYLIRYKLKTANDYRLIDINDSSVKSRVLTNLAGDYEFQIAAYDTNNLYSSFVNLAPH